MFIKAIGCISFLAVSIMAQGVFAQGNLNMVCSAPQPACDTIITEFSKQTGINVSMIRMSAGEVYAKLRAEARNPKVDIWFSGTHETHYQVAADGLTQSYQSSQLDNLIPLARQMANDTDHKANAHGVITIGFTWNEEILKEKKLPEPTSWADLLRPEYKGEIAFSNPNTAGTAYTTIVALVELMGEDGAFDYMKKLNSNISSYTKSGSAVGAQAARGESSIAVMFLHDANILLRQGFPMKIAHPSEGTGYALDSVSIVKGARNLDEAKKFVDWVLTPEGQSINIANGLNSHPTAKGAIFSEYTVSIDGVKLLDLDHKFYGTPEKRKHLLNRWDQEIGAIAGR